MGHISHTAVVITGDVAAIDGLLPLIRNRGLPFIGPCCGQINNYSTVCVVPCGSKCGWPPNRRHIEGIDALVAELPKGLEWVRIQYGIDDSCVPIIVDSFAGCDAQIGSLDLNENGR